MRKFFDDLLGIDQNSRNSTKFQQRVGWFVLLFTAIITIYAIFIGIIDENTITEIVLTYLGYSAILFGVNIYRVTQENKAKIESESTQPDEIIPEISTNSTVTTKIELSDK